MAINVSVQYNGGLLPDIILLTQCYHHHRGMRLNAMKMFLSLQPMIPPTKRFDISPPCVVVVVVVDSHIQRIVLATEETTVTQQVSHRPIKRQSRLWSQRGTKVNGSHHGDNPLLRPTGIQIATKSYAALQAMAPTNIKTVHQTSLLHSRATSIDSECCRLPTTSVLSKKPEKLRSNQF